MIWMATGSRCNMKVRRPHGFAHLLNELSLVVIAVSVLFAPVAGIAGTRGARPIDACALLMASELSTLFGVPVEAGVRHDAGRVSDGAYSSTCIWKVQNANLPAHNKKAPLGGADFAILNVISWPSRSGAESLLRTLRTAADHHLIPMHPVALHIGDESAWWGDGVAVRTGTVSFGISVVLKSADRDKRRVWEELLARKILPRIRYGGST